MEVNLVQIAWTELTALTNSSPSLNIINTTTPWRSKRWMMIPHHDGIDSIHEGHPEDQDQDQDQYPMLACFYMEVYLYV
jgi:hypothetical protein